MEMRRGKSLGDVSCCLAVALSLSLPSAYGQPADISLSSRSVTPTTANSGDPVAGTISGNWWTEAGMLLQTWYLVAGFRSNAGAWVGGEPVGVAGMQGPLLPLLPGSAFSGNGFIGLAAPTSAGTYSVWVQMVPAGTLNEAITAFKAATATVETQYHRQVGTVEVPLCALGLCASGAGGMIPVIVLGLALMKVEISRRRRRRC